MTATLTKSTPVSDRRAKPGRNIVYIKSPFDNIADEFASQHGVWNLPFKCKTWTKVCNETNKVNAQALKELFPEATSIKFSAKAGCKCGCSQGYIVKTNSYLPSTNNWVTIEATEEETSNFRTQINRSQISTALLEELAERELV